MKTLVASTLMIVVSFSAGVFLSSATHPPAISDVDRVSALYRNVRADRQQCQRELDLALEGIEALELTVRASEELLSVCLDRLPPIPKN